MAKTGDFVLVVIHPFADYQRGQEIADAVLIAEILAGECASYVVKRSA